MGRKLTDGKALDRTIPDGQAVDDYELVRIDGVNGLVVNSCSATDVERLRALETDVNATYRIHVPSGVNPSPGDFLYWTANDDSTFQYGPSHLRTTPVALGQPPCFWVTEARAHDLGGTNYVLSGRVLNGVTGTGSLS